MLLERLAAPAAALAIGKNALSGASHPEASTGVLSATLSNAGPGVIAVSGPAKLDGSLALVLTPGFTSLVGRMFTIVKLAITGSFSHVLSPPGETFQGRIAGTNYVVKHTA